MKLKIIIAARQVRWMLLVQPVKQSRYEMNQDKLEFDIYEQLALVS